MRTVSFRSSLRLRRFAGSNFGDVLSLPCRLKLHRSIVSIESEIGSDCCKRFPSRSSQFSRDLSLGNSFACETPMSPASIAFTLGRAAPRRAAMHSTTRLACHGWCFAERAGTRSRAADFVHGVGCHFSSLPRAETLPTTACPPSFTVTC